MTDKTTRTTSRWLRVNLWLHRWSSLVATLPFLILCLTGTILIFHEEIDSVMGVVPTAPGLGEVERPLADSVASALAAFPGAKVNLLGIDAKAHPGLLQLGTSPIGDSSFDNSTFHFAHLATGKLMAESFTEGGTLTGFLLELHSQWFVGVIGELIGALVALLILISLLSGLVVYGPHARRAALGTLRRGRGPRLRQLDLHNFIGVIVLAWMLVVASTGFLLGFGSLATGIWTQSAFGRMQQQYDGPVVDVRAPPVNVDGAYTAALSAAPPGWSVSLIIWPGTQLSTPAHYTVLINGSGLDEQLFRVMQVDARTGVMTSTVELPWYMKAIIISQPLHFGNYGGLALKLLWTVCVWLTLFITFNGAWLWWNRRPKRRPTSQEVSI